MNEEPSMPVGETAPYPTGWRHDPPEVRRVVASLPMPFFRSAAPGLAGTGAGQNVLLYKAWKDVNGSYIDYPAQEIGDCVSMGHAHGIDLLECVQVALGHKSEELHLISTEAVYGMARVDIGGERGSYSDGAVGAWAAKAVSTLGTVSRDVTGPYDGRRAKEWGARGVPADIKAKAVEHKVQTVSLVTTWAELEDALANGFPVTVCSNQGFTLERDGDGFCAPYGHWAHCCPPEAMIAGLSPRRADRLKVGDEVIGHDGRLHQVVAQHARPYVGDMIVIKAAGLPPVRFTTDHPILVEREVSVRTTALPAPDFAERAGVVVLPVTLRERKRVRDWVRAVDVKPGDRLLMPRWADGDSHRMGADWIVSPAHHRNIPRKIYGTEAELAWLFGLFIANGNVDPGHRIVITLPTSKPDLEQRTVAAIRSLDLEPIIVREDKHIRVRVDSSIVANTFRAWFYGDDAEKRVPEFLFRDGWNLRTVVEGIYAGDGEGSKTLKRARIYTTSRTLMSQLWMILVAIGRRPTIDIASRSKGTYANAKPLYNVNFARETDDGPQRKKHHPGYAGDYYALPVVKVEAEPYDGMVYNWEVEGSNSYVADGVAVHNCMLIVGIRADRPGANIFQSWGSQVPSGPLALDQPPNSFWAEKPVVESMLGMQDSWALSSFQGYPRTPLPSSWTYEGFA
jgi:hypothetical protein